MPWTRSAAESGSHRLALASSLLALACVLGLIEAAIGPPIPVPGLKLGFANVAVVMTLAVLGRREALAVSCLRVVIVGLATGALMGPAGLMALSGAVASWAVMALLYGAGSRFSPVGWSVAGSALHVGAQLGVATLILGSTAPLKLMPAALAAALVTGMMVGYLSLTLLSRLPLPARSETGEGREDGAAPGARVPLVP